jgi:hypothetical protein
MPSLRHAGGVENLHAESVVASDLRGGRRDLRRRSEIGPGDFRVHGRRSSLPAFRDGASITAI